MEKRDVASKNDTTSSDNLVLKIFFCMLVFLILVLSVTDIYLFLNNGGQAESPVETQVADDNNTSKKSLSELNKQEAIEEYINIQNSKGILSVDEMKEILPSDGDSSMTILLYSYGNEEEIPKIALENSMMTNYKRDLSADVFNINKINDYYSIVTVDPNLTECGTNMLSTCSKGISFDKEFLDYHREETSDTYGLNGSDILTFKNMDNDFMKAAIPILISLVLQPTDETRANVYDYTIGENPDNYEIRIDKIGVGMNMQKLRNGSFSPGINLYNFGYKIDKNTGEVTAILYDNDSVRNIVNSFDLDSQDLEYLRSEVENFPL